MKKEHMSIWVLLALILGCGSVLRLNDLGFPTMGIDVMEFYKVGLSGLSPGTLLVENPDILAGCPPLWFAAHNGFLQVFGLDVNFVTIRLLDALTGILAIVAAFFLGREAGRARTGLLAALFVALHPIHIQMSRECYFYVAVTLGCFLMLAAIFRLINCLEKKHSPDVLFYVFVIPGFLLTTNIQMSSWAFAFLTVIALYMVLLPAVLRKKVSCAHLLWLTGLLFLIGLPPLLSRWGVRMAYTMAFGSGREQWGVVFGNKTGGFWGSFWEAFSSFLVGRGSIRSLCSIVLTMSGLFALFRFRKEQRKIRVFTWLFFGTIVLLAVMLWRSVFPSSARYYSSFFPLTTVLIALGLSQPIRLSWAWDSLLVGFGIILIVCLFAQPALLAMRVDGFPPYKAVSTWVDRHFPSGKVILCDRWLTPWNEFRINPSISAVYTFTVPNEPIQAYEQNQWRKTAEMFLERNPEAAFFESKQYWTRLSPWTWPAENYANKVEFIDECGMELDRIGLCYRAPPLDMPDEWVPVTLYYNTRVDLIRRAREDGRDVLRFYNEGWTYAKPGWQRGDFGDYRLVGLSASIELHNLQRVPQQGFLEIFAAVAGAPKTVSIDGSVTVFSSGRFRLWVLPLMLQPGPNTISVTSPSSDPLFVRDICWKVEPAQSPTILTD